MTADLGYEPPAGLQESPLRGDHAHDFRSRQRPLTGQRRGAMVPTLNQGQEGGLTWAPSDTTDKVKPTLEIVGFKGITFTMSPG